MVDEGYLQIKLREANGAIEKLCEREKYLTLKYDRMESLLNNELNSILKDIEDVKKTKQEINELPKKLFEYNKEKMDEIIGIHFSKHWHELYKQLKETFTIQSKINAEEFKQVAKRYIADNLRFEIELGAVQNILLNKKIMTKEYFDKYQKEYRKRVKPLVNKHLRLHSTISHEAKNIDKIIGSDFEFQNEVEELIKENNKILRSK